MMVQTTKWNENEDDEININWSDITFDDVDKSSSTMPNENETADDEMDISWENTAFDNPGFSAESSPLMPNEEDFEFDIDDNNNNSNSKKRQRRSAVLTPCVLLHNDQGTMRRCNSNINLRPLKQLIGTWEIDGNAIKDKDADELLGVCESDFLFDMNNLHSENAKQLVDSENSYVHYRICLFCNKLKWFSSRGKYCREHSWHWQLKV